MSISVDAYKCPACGSVMSNHTVEDLSLSVCSNCGGVWYGAGQLTRLENNGPKVAEVVEALEPAVVKFPEGGAPGKCPICVLPLHRHKFEGTDDIIVDGCYNCGGVFMEPSALKKLDQREHVYPDHKTAPQASPEAIALGAQLDVQTIADIYQSQNFARFGNMMSTRLPYI